TAGLYYRSRPELHKRLMLLATLNVLPAAVSRIPIGAARLPFAFILLSLLTFACPIYDRLVRGRMQPISLWGGVGMSISGPLRILIGSTDAWHRLALWLIR